VTRVWRAVLESLDAGGAAALVTIVGAQGSTPRAAGTRMVVRMDGAFTGTIGGGALEWRALAEARTLMAGGAAQATLDAALGPDLGQCCGGRATLRIERFDRADRAWIAPLAEAERSPPVETVATVDARGVLVRRLRTADAAAAGEVETFGEAPTPLLLFGAGHVGRALALALAPLPFAVVWIDGRPDAFPAHVPANVTCVALADPGPLLARAAAGSLVLAMTHSHALDLAVVAAALPDGRFPFVGLIGSRTKRVRFSRRLRDAGCAPETVGRLVCPIGLGGVRSKEPAAIAAAVALQLLVERERLAGESATSAERMSA
jgi:xanthine dehydrogenase accessory factor